MSTCQCCSIQSDCEKLLRTSVLPYMATFAVLVSVTSTLSVHATRRLSNTQDITIWEAITGSPDTCVCMYTEAICCSVNIYGWIQPLTGYTDDHMPQCYKPTTLPYCYKWPHASLFQMTTLASLAHKAPHGLCRVAKDHSYTWHHGSGNIHSLLSHHNIYSEHLVLKKLLLCAYTNTTQMKFIGLHQRDCYGYVLLCPSWASCNCQM